MRTRILFVLTILFLNQSCGGDKHLPSSNPPEYDPKKVYTTPSSAPNQPAPQATQPAEPAPPPIQFPSLEPGPNEKGEWRKVPVKPESLQLLKGAKTVCDTLSQLVQGLGSAQLFAGAEGAALKKSLGSQVESTSKMLDEQLAESMKQALGPAAANCPTPGVKSRKTSSLKYPSQSTHIVLTNSSASPPLSLAQAAPSQGLGDGYTITTTKQRQDAPPGWIGGKTTDRTTRIGNKPETAGNRSSHVLVLGGKVLKCPTPDGAVAGDFEYAVVLDQTIVESGVTRMVHIGLYVLATLKGQVGDDAQVQYVEGDLSTVAERNGTDVPTSLRRRRSQFRFTLSRDEFHPGFPTNITPISETSWDIEGATQQEDGFAGSAAGAVMFWGGQTYLEAQKEWHKPNTCVEIVFTPATKTHKLGPNESVAVKTELRSKKEQTLVPAKFKEAKERPREGNGNVSPRQAESQPGAPAMFTYKAPATRAPHNGFWVGAISRAGVAQAQDGEWEAAEGAYVLEFQSRIIDREPTAPAESVAAGNVMLTLVEGKDMYRGSGMVGYQTGPPPNRDPCTSMIMGHGTTRLDVAGMFIRLSERAGTGGSQVASADIELHYLIHPTNETERLYTMVNYRCVPGELVPYPFFYSLYAVSRGAEEINLLKDWTYVGRNGVVATKTLHGNCGDLCEDVTVFTLKEMNEEASLPR
jgi:hypothetical protein